MCCLRLYSHAGWLLLKCSAIGIGFNGAETNCGVARILGILVINRLDFFGAESKSQGYAHFHELIQSPVIEDMTWKPFYTFNLFQKKSS